MGEESAEELLTLEVLQSELDRIATHSGSEFRKALEVSFPVKNAGYAAMRFLFVKTTFTNTLAGRGDYCHTILISFNDKVYRATFRGNRDMSLRELPRAVKDLAWRDVEHLGKLLELIQPGTAEELPSRLEKALPDELGPELDAHTRMYMLTDAVAKESGGYRFEIKLRCGAVAVKELGMELSDFVVLLG